MTAPQTLKVVIIGAGDLGALLAHHLRSVPELEVAGFVDDTRPPGASLAGRVLGGSADVRALHGEGVCDAFLIAVGYRHFKARQQLFESLSEVLPAATFIHPSAHVDSAARVMPGAVVFPRAVIDVGAVVEANVLVNTAAVVCHHTHVGAHSFVAPAACIAGFVRVGRRCFVGMNASIRDNVVITDDVVIGAGAVVARDIETAGVHVGVPARLLCEPG